MGANSEEMPHISMANLYDPIHDLQDLVNPITMEEILSMIKDWPTNKSPGLDGFTGEFYKEFKDVIVHDLYRVINEVFQKGYCLDKLNTSYIVLIPKKETTKGPHGFRPISLLHSIQKMISKILATRLQSHISSGKR